MKIKLEYGRTGLEVEIPDADVTALLGLGLALPLENPEEAVQLALLNPIGSVALREAASGRTDACIVVCDVTRPVPNPLLLPFILDELAIAGIPRGNVTILIATGTHRPNLGDELERMIGTDAFENCRVVNHYCTDIESCRDLGMSPNGVPIKLNKLYLDADFRITVGMIEPHFMAGYAGGRKMVMPGVAAMETIQKWHSPRFLEHRNATSGVVKDNPVHEESLAIARLARPNFIVDVALDSNKKTCAVFAGDMEEAWEAGVAFVAKNSTAAIPQPVDIALTTCGGFPLDATFYQAIKGMVGALPIVKHGGTVIVAAECSEGIGSPHFRDALFNLDRIDNVVERMNQPDWKFLTDQWQVEELAKAVRHHHIILICNGIPAVDVARLFVTPAATVSEALSIARQRHGQRASLAVIPKGPYVNATIAPTVISP